MTPLYQLTVAQAREMLARGEISSLELTDALLTRIAAVEPKVRAFLVVDAAGARAQARAADARRAAGDASPLLGIPMGIKDVISTQGLRTTCASKMLENYTPVYDATAVARLKAAGAVILGKLNCDEFAMGSSTENSAFQQTRNPWNLERVPGGSSGGSAAAVAAGEAPAALGTDTGGSIRQPAALCGITGLKPTYGRVSRYGLVAFASSLDQIGPMARTVRDCAIVLRVIAGADPFDATCTDYPAPDYEAALTGDIRGLRIGVPREYFVAGMQPDVEAAVRTAIEVLREQGAEVCEISLPHTPYALPVYYLIAPAEASANLARFDGVRYGLRVPGESYFDELERTRGAGFGPEVRRRIMLGTYALSAGYYDAYYKRAQQVRTLIRRDYQQAFEQVDVIAAPTTPTVAFKIGAHTDDPLAMYLEDVCTLPLNLAGLPGLVVPCGFAEGLPIGLQLIGRAFDEESLLRVGDAYQRVTDWHTRMPEVREDGSA
ncbi:Asp-tRNA(Asn)/Glu-tRNA(Gln) amidotransferase subunit GatA [Roseiflexus castenholzii]|jgi:aspartyl-tRNA(Asn)/glutamyl-tRNA(Gln) amidotransferase subunit A|uniref:Glutamyl-tRNA(Gln) amidotransferase subunit A n=1 Tax=Roseiflexus castenholzii (strain DSM 13941 / HLO8) TaxID=383372 RepID=GATA_ROSCS|nr:Asp-tRNA(Asn)/Glu-tRNA(Gln) amidotransferase subunit GatA [Roseiflexus castenholzii]A7NKM0.1 RecName: Full=Glutamyl-tRNA(Gln) amidotransferase subunit A; Short=Glu-ADT subunit A [Roseiflexus castenholzii DSM 13941]ABU58040.1 glutamyl-tRNA(Gln) amidotransferase, A subunit [Roseiflexus castenholzii DSM 13941]